MDVNTAGYQGRTALQAAVGSVHLEVVERLLLARDDVAADSKDHEGRTPLSWAAMREHEAVVQLLVEREDVAADSKDYCRRTPLSWAAEEGHEAVVQLLLARDDVAADSKDRLGRTPLSWAAGRRHEAVVKLTSIESSSRSLSGQAFEWKSFVEKAESTYLTSDYKTWRVSYVRFRKLFQIRSVCVVRVFFFFCSCLAYPQYSSCFVIPSLRLALAVLPIPEL